MIDLELVELEIKKEFLDGILAKHDHDQLRNWMIVGFCLFIVFLIIVIW